MIDFSSGYSYREILDAMLDQVDNGLDKREGSLIQTAITSRKQPMRKLLKARILTCWPKRAASRDGRRPLQ